MKKTEDFSPVGQTLQRYDFFKLTFCWITNIHFPIIHMVTQFNEDTSICFRNSFLLCFG